MSRKLPPEVWPGEDEPRYAVRVDRATEDEALAAVLAYAFATPEQIRYVGIQVVNLPEDEGQKGRRRRAHIFEGAG